MNAIARLRRPRTLASVLAALALAFLALHWPGGTVAPVAPARSAPASQQVARAPAPREPAPVAGRIEIEQFGRRAPSASAAGVREAFTAAPWSASAAEPAAAPASAPKGRPGAPPPPFEFMGRYDDGSGASVVLLMDERVYIVSAGQVIDGTWRVDRLGAAELELTYLPLRAKQTMRTGE